MNKKIYLVLLVVILGVCMGVYAVYSYTILKPKTEKLVSNTKPIPTPKVEDKKETSQSILDLITSGKSLECSFSSTTENIKTTGTTYVNNNKLKGEFNSNINDKDIKNYILSDGVYFYSWSADSNQGIKMKVSDVNSNLKSQQLDSFKKFNDKYEYNCKAWVNADNAFEPPSNVKFSDLTNLSTTPSSNINMCSGCDFITDETSKSECKKQFNCK